MPGFQVGETCYPTAKAAGEAIASNAVGTLVTHNGKVHSVQITQVTDTVIGYRLDPIGGPAFLDHPTNFQAQPCNLMSLGDGLQIGWMVAAAWIAVFCVLFITKALRGETDGSYGSS